MAMGIQNVLVSAGLVVTGLKSITLHLRFRSALSRLRVAEVQKTCNDLQLSYTCACFISQRRPIAQQHWATHGEATSSGKLFVRKQTPETEKSQTVEGSEPLSRCIGDATGRRDNFRAASARPELEDGEPTREKY